MANVKDIPAEFQAYCAVAGDLLDTRVAEENSLVSEYEGQTYYFCCPPCKPTFMANPEHYAGDTKKQISLVFKDKEHIVDNIWSFSFAPSELINWMPGQYIRIEVPHDNADAHGDKRWFTISSAPYEKLITITTRVSSSTFKQALASLELNATIEMTDLPSGDFIWGESDQTERVFIVGGIGITPFYSIAKQRQYDNLPLNATLIYANRTDDVAFREYFDSLKGEGLNVQYLSGRDMTIDTILEASTGNTARFYISGAKPMVEQFVNDLEERGVTKGQITQDAFPRYSEQTY